MSTIDAHNRENESSFISMGNTYALEKQLYARNIGAVASASRTAKLRPESGSRAKPELKSFKKEAPNSFPSNVRSLISTGPKAAKSLKHKQKQQGIIVNGSRGCVTRIQ
ncbi:hypothetical protein COLO4_38503 [Corchorus olitorius]|uniref:Uncharacterized protein n=1 Tax=Corchorus olitorius TaxID=93759 RepID=A0A1R3FUN9_9ROSI|nr:hypothetical protein COLO4_38503 [Corchorus olitorius]